MSIDEIFISVIILVSVVISCMPIYQSLKFNSQLQKRNTELLKIIANDGRENGDDIS